MAFLLAIDGPQAGQEFEITGQETILGRHPQCDVVIDVGAVSRHHARIRYVNGEYRIEDMHSRNGTYLNDRQARNPMTLAEADRIRICDVSFAFHHKRASERGHTPSSTVDGSSFNAVLIDDESATSGSTIMSKLDVTTSHGQLQMAASAEVKLGALLEITQSLGRVLSLDEVLPQVLNTLFKIFVQADRGLIVLKDDDGRLVPRWTKWRREDEDDTIRISRTIVNQVMESKEAILSADAASDSRFDMSESIADFRIRSMVCAPLVDTEGKAFGVLQIDTFDQRNRFQADDLEVLVSVASQAAISIASAQLHEAALGQRALERDLELAHVVQRGFLPDDPPLLDAYEFYNYYQPANRVGGDYFDYISLPDGRLAVIVADVVGHGVAAALLMAKLSAEVRFCLASQLHPASAITQLNASFGNGNLEDRFVTLIMAVLNPQTHEMTIVNAGHMAPMLRRVEGEVEDAGEAEAGLPLGVLDDYQYQQCQITLSPGEIITLYTDGINEAHNNQGSQYTIERIRKQVAATAESAATVGRNIIADVRRFIGREPQGDDMCLVCFGRSWGVDKDDSRPEATAVG